MLKPFCVIVLPVSVLCSCLKHFVHSDPYVKTTTAMFYPAQLIPDKISFEHQGVCVCVITPPYTLILTRNQLSAEPTGSDRVTAFPLILISTSQ